VAAQRSSGSGGIGVARAEDGSWGRLQRWPAEERHVGSLRSRRWRGVATTASSGEGRLGRTVGRRGKSRDGQRGVGEGGSEARCRTALRRRGWRTWPAIAVAARGRETEERERGVDEGGPGCKIQKGQGSYSNSQITFKPELK
jgi:hypothetical protein